jgi:hypothetical protein
MMNFYVYVYLREDDSPYYVGKGCNGRCYSSIHNCEVPPKDRIIFLISETTEEWALFMEMEFIDVWGRLDDGTGILENRTDGGDCPPKQFKYLVTPYERTKEFRMKLSEKEKNNPNRKGKGHPQTEDTKKRISESVKLQHATGQKEKLERDNRGRFMKKCVG